MLNFRRIRTSLSFLGLCASFISSLASAGEFEQFTKNLSGCFQVSFKYIEDGEHDQTIDGLYEWIAPIQLSPFVSLQHVGIAEGHVFKHFREEWTNLSDGNWYQRVIGPYEDFRYECAATNNLNQWRCLAEQAPKPRRDKDRKDYKTLDRENTVQVTSKGWVQAENNLKRDKNGTVVSTELGWNEYIRVNNELCKPAIDFLNMK